MIYECAQCVIYFCWPEDEIYQVKIKLATVKKLEANISNISPSSDREFCGSEPAIFVRWFWVAWFFYGYVKYIIVRMSVVLKKNCCWWQPDLKSSAVTEYQQLRLHCSLWLWWWLLHGLYNRQSQSPIVLSRTTLTRTVVGNRLMTWLLGSNCLLWRCMASFEVNILR